MATPVRQQRKDVLNTPAAQRAGFLWKAASALLPSALPVANHLSVQLRQVCQAQSTPLPKSADQLTCARCESLLLPGVNSRVLSGRPKKRPDNRAVLYHCLACTHAGAYAGDSRAVERSAKAEQAAREKIEQLASEAVVERAQQGPKRKRAKGGLLNLKALARGGKPAVPFECSPGLPVLDRPSTVVIIEDDLAAVERGYSAVRSSVPEPTELVEGLEAAKSGHPELSEAVSTPPATVEGAATNTTGFSNPEESSKPDDTSGTGGFTTSKALTTPEPLMETNPDNPTVPDNPTDPKGLSKPDDPTKPEGLTSSRERSKAQPLPALEPSDEPRLQTQTQGSPPTMAVEAASDEIQAISLLVGGLLYSAFGEGVTAQTRTEAPPLEVPLTENLEPQTPSAQVGASLAAETGPPQIGALLPAEGRSAQMDVSPPAETPPPQKERPLSRTSGRSVLGRSMAAKASQGGRQASPQAPGGAEKFIVEEGNAQQDDPKDRPRLSLGGGALEANQSLQNGGHEAAGASTVNAGAPSGAPQNVVPAPSKDASPKTLNPATELESSIDTETTRGRMSLRRSARKEGAGEALGAPPRKDEGATSETPIRRSLRSAGGGSVPAETGTPLRRSTRRGGSVEPDAKKAVATPGRRSVRNGGGNEPGSEPPASRSSRRGGSKERSAEAEKLPKKEGAGLEADMGKGSRKEGGDGRKLGAIFELLDAPAGLADPSGGVHGAPGQSSQDTFLTATQESIAPGSAPQAEAAPPPEAPLVESQDSQLEVTVVQSPAKLSEEVPPGPVQTKSPEGAKPGSIEEKKDEMEGGDGGDFSFPGFAGEKAGALVPLPLQSELSLVKAAGSDNPRETTEAAPAVKSPVKRPEGQIKSPVKEQAGQGESPAIGETAKLNAQGEGKGLSGGEAAVGQAGIVGGKEETSQEEKAAVLGEALETVEEVLREVERVDMEEGGQAEPGDKSGASPPARKRRGELDTEAFPAAKRPAFPSPVLIVPLSEEGQVGPVEEKPAALHAYKSARPESEQGPSLSPDIISAIGLEEVISEPGVHFASETEPPVREDSAPAAGEPPGGEQNGTLSRSGSEQGSKANLRGTRFPPEGIHTSEEALGSWQTLADGLLISPLSNLGVEGSFPHTPTPRGALVGGDVMQERGLPQDDVMQERELPKDDVTQDRERPNGNVTEADDRTEGRAIPGGLEQGGGGRQEALVPSALALGGVFAEEQEKVDTGLEGTDVIPPKIQPEGGRGGPASGLHKVAQAASESGKPSKRRPGKSEGWWGEQAGLSSEQQRALQNAYAEMRANAESDGWAESLAAIAAEQEEREKLEEQLSEMKAREAALGEQLNAMQAERDTLERGAAARERGLERLVDEVIAEKEALERHFEERMRDVEAEKESLERGFEERMNEVVAEKEALERDFEQGMEEMTANKAAMQEELEAKRNEVLAQKAALEAELEEQRKLKVDAYKTAWQLAVEKYHRGALEKYETMRDDLEDRLEDLTRSRGQAYATIAGQQRTIGRLLERLQVAKSAQKRGAEGTSPGVARKKQRVSDGRPSVMVAVTVAATKKRGEVSVRDGIPKPAVFRWGEKVMSIRQGVPEAAKMTGGDVVKVTDGGPLPRRKKRRGPPPERKIDIDLVSSEEDEPPKASGAEGGARGGKRKRVDGGEQTVRVEDVPFRVPRYPIGPPRLDPNVGFFKYGRHWRTYWKREPPPSVLYENEMDDSE